MTIKNDIPSQITFLIVIVLILSLMGIYKFYRLFTVKDVAIFQVINVETAITHFCLDSHWYPKIKVKKFSKGTYSKKHFPGKKLTYLDNVKGNKLKVSI